jgi:RNA polymerase primary sigma factor
VVLSDRALRQLARIKHAHSGYVQVEGHEPTGAALAQASGLSEEQVDHLLSVDRAPRGLGEPVGAGEPTSTTVGEEIADPRADEDYDWVFRRADLEQLRGLPGELDEREREILRDRFGIGGREHSLQEIGGGLGLSAERVRQIEVCALEKLHSAAQSAGMVAH